MHRLINKAFGFYVCRNNILVGPNYNFLTPTINAVHLSETKMIFLQNELFQTLY